MVRFGLIAFLVCMITSIPILSAESDSTAPKGFHSLFNGKNLEGWHATPHFDPRELKAMDDKQRQIKIDDWMTEAKKHWYIDNGELVNDGKGPYLTTNKVWKDIELRLEYKTVSQADSGIYLRNTPQVQIWDSTFKGGKWNRGADRGSGGLFNNAHGTPGRLPLMKADKTFGEWNTFRIIQTGARTTVWLNGQLVVKNSIMENFWDRSRPLFPSGSIQLQTHGGEIRWRNIWIRTIASEEANRLLSGSDPDAINPVFNGKDFSGWHGDYDGYEIKDGAIVSRKNRGGNLYTQNTYGNFVANMEFRLSPGGHSGLAIRYPGTGNPYHESMCIIPILDSTNPRFTALDPRDNHGSIHGSVAAHPGYLRPTGEWNFQQVTVHGSTVRVELNGYTIVDADLSNTVSSSDQPPSRSKPIQNGYFGFIGQGEPVAFRNISVKHLPSQPKTASQWPQFRGPNASGTASWKKALPITIGPDEPFLWKSEFPAGHSSPVVFGNRIFLTAEKDKTLLTVCVNRQDGTILWQRESPYQKLEEIHEIGSHAQSSPVTDGHHVVSFFGSSGMYCYDMEGNLLWKKSFGPFNNTFGSGTSPVISGDAIILCQDHDTDSFLISLNKHDGSTNWITDRREFPRNYCTPVIWTVNGKKQIVVAATLRVVGYDFNQGKELWTVRGIARTVCMTPVIGSDNTLYVSGWAGGGGTRDRIVVSPFETVLQTHDQNQNGTLEKDELEEGGAIHRRFVQVDRDKTGSVTETEYEYFRYLFDNGKNMLIAIRPGGSGDLTETHVAWKFRRYLPFCASPLFYNGYLFTIKDGGILTSLNAQTGQPLKTNRIPGSAPYYSSPVAADGKVYLFDQRGRTTVVSAWADWTILATSDFGEDIYATPAIADGQLFVRTNGHLYCFGTPPESH